MPRGVLFDVDGTLVDSVDLHAAAWKDAFERFGKRPSFAEVRSQIGKGADQLLPVFLTDEERSRFGEELDRFRSDRYEREYLPKVRAFPCARDLVLRARERGLRIGLASSAKSDELTHYKRLAGVTDLIDYETSADDVERSKPYPDVFCAGLAGLGLSAADTVVVGDTPYDVQAACRAGMPTIALLCGGFPREDLDRAGASAIYRDPCDLLEHYDDSPLAR